MLHQAGKFRCKGYVESPLPARSEVIKNDHAKKKKSSNSNSNSNSNNKKKKKKKKIIIIKIIIIQTQLVIRPNDKSPQTETFEYRN